MSIEVKFIVEGTTTNPEPAKVLKALDRAVRYGLGPGWTVTQVATDEDVPKGWTRKDGYLFMDVPTGCGEGDVKEETGTIIVPMEVPPGSIVRAYGGGGRSASATTE